jgi:RimJ/RimL family protein N-acetyltransferase
MENYAMAAKPRIDPARMLHDQVASASPDLLRSLLTTFLDTLLPDGEPAGFVIPAHNGYNPIIAYLGMVPAHRGHDHVHDVLAADTALLAAHNVPRIRAATDVGNAPMAAAFAGAGYVTFERQIDMTWR